MIFTDVVLGVFLECTSATGGIAPRLFRFAARIAPGLLCFSAVCLQRKHLLLISNLPLLYEHVLCCSAIYSAHRRWPVLSVLLVCFVLPLVISSWFVRCDYPRALLNGQTPTCFKS